jgi:uncharacterized membrane-anchored protein YhcB (DUF1043 family)
MRNWTMTTWGTLGIAAYFGAAIGATIARWLLTGVLP